MKILFMLSALASAGYLLVQSMWDSQPAMLTMGPESDFLNHSMGYTASIVMAVAAIAFLLVWFFFKRKNK